MGRNSFLLCFTDLFEKQVKRMRRPIDPFFLYQPMRFGLVFLGKDIKDLENVLDFEKRVVFFPIWRVFFQFFGVNKFFSFYVCERMGIYPLLHYCSFPRNNSMFLLEIMVSGLVSRCDRALHRHVLITCALLVALKCRRGKRHALSRTTRGQCTRRNGNTAKKQLYNWLLLFEKVSSVDFLYKRIGKSSSIHEELRSAVVPFYKKKRREKKKVQVVKSAAVIREHAKVRKTRAYMAGKVLKEKRPLEQIVRRALLKKKQKTI